MWFMDLIMLTPFYAPWILFVYRQSYIPPAVSYFTRTGVCLTTLANHDPLLLAQDNAA